MGWPSSWFWSVAVVGFAATHRAEIWPVAFAALVLVLIFGGPVRRGRLDEGGLRFQWPFGLAKQYRPLEEIGSAEPADDALGIFDSAGRLVDRWLLGTPSKTADAFIQLSARLDTRHLVELSGLDRLGLGLESWLDVLTARTREAEAVGPYRDAELDLDRAESILADTGATLDLRAGAAFVLLCARDPRHHARARAAIGDDAPPLVVALAALADAGQSFRARAEREIGFLTPEDRRAFARLAARWSKS